MTEVEHEILIAAAFGIVAGGDSISDINETLHDGVAFTDGEVIYASLTPWGYELAERAAWRWHALLDSVADTVFASA